MSVDTVYETLLKRQQRVDLHPEADQSTHAVDSSCDNEGLHHKSTLQWIRVHLVQFVFKKYGQLMDSVGLNE